MSEATGQFVLDCRVSDAIKLEVSSQIVPHHLTSFRDERNKTAAAKEELVKKESSSARMIN
jgi:hypothetical protein